MEWIAEERRKVAGTWLEVRTGKIGEDLLVTVEGGDRPHIGCAVQEVRGDVLCQAWCDGGMYRRSSY